MKCFYIKHFMISRIILMIYLEKQKVALHMRDDFTLRIVFWLQLKIFKFIYSSLLHVKFDQNQNFAVCQISLLEKKMKKFA